MKLKRIIAGISAVVMSVSALSFSAVSTVAADPADDVFDNLNQQQITEAMSPGWNVGNQLEANSNGTPNETAWQSTKITKELIHAVKEAGFKSIRIPVGYLSKIGAAPNYTIDAAWLDRIQEVVDYCVDEGLYAIVNMHSDGYNSIQGGWLLCNAPEEQQPAIKEKYAACWKQIAEKFKDYDEHLIFESMNEEFDGVTYSGNINSTYASNINDYNQIFVDTVRQTGVQEGNNAKRWLLVPYWNTDIEYTAGNYGFVIPTDTYRDKSIPDDEQRIMISVHYYAPWDFCGTENGATTTWGTDDQIKALKDQFTRCYAKFVLSGYPVVIGEWGSIDKTTYNANNNQYRALFAKEVCKAARSMSIIPVYWDNGWNGVHGFGLFNRATCAVTQQGIIDAIMDAYKGEAEPAPEVNTPITKDEALAIIYSSNKATTLVSGVADASMADAVQIRYVFDCAADVSFNQYSNINLVATIDEIKSNVTITGSSDLEGATKLTAVLDLKNPIKEGDSYSISAYTASWGNASDYVFLIRCVEFLDADGNVIKTIDKSNKPAEPTSDPTNNSGNSNNNNPTTPPTTAPTTAKPAVTTATPKCTSVAEAKQAAKTAMKQAKITKLTVKSKAKKKITVTWKKVNKATGYEVQVSSNKKFKKSKILVKKNVKKANVTIKNKKIKSKKTYYVRVRAYATYKDAKGATQKVYSSWNKQLRKVKVK